MDADACPVKDEILRVAARHGLVTTFVANSGLRPSRDPLIRNVLVPQGADAADNWIAEHCAPGDIVVTADIPLAGRVLEAGGFALGPAGRPFTPQSIGMALAMRELNQHLREIGERGSHNAAFTARDRTQFLQTLDEVVQRARRVG